MSPSKGQNPAQGELIVTAERTGQMQARDFSEYDGAAVNLIEQKLHLMNCLGQLAGASMREGLLRAGEGVVLDRYGEKASAVVLGAARVGEDLAKQAKWSFAHAFGQFAMEKSGLANPQDARTLTAGSFHEFKRHYYGPAKHKEAHAFLMSLGKQIENLKTTSSQFNREHGFRPHQGGSVKVPEAVSKPDRQELEKLNTRERLQAILYDPRAGFIPATNLEKNIVMSFLDYLDNPDYPLGVNDQLFEVLAHVQKKVWNTDHTQVIRRGTFAEGRRAMESISWQLGDFLIDAARSHTMLTILKEETWDVSPAVTLTEELGEDYPAIPLVTRYHDLLEYLQEGAVKGLGRVPLRTAEDRWVPHGAEPSPGKHKAIHSQYTRPDRTKAFERHITSFASGATFGEVRKYLDDAIDNEVKRAGFMYECLKDIFDVNEHHVVEPIRVAVKTSLEAIKNERIVQLLTDDQLRQAS